jgi:hypothetical protein
VSYRYEEHAAWLASAEGVKAIGQVIRNVESKLDPAQAATMAALWPRGVGTTDHMQAAVDHVAMLGMIEEIPLASPPWGQHRVFRRPER